MESNSAAIKAAREILHNNDMGGYTVPTHDLYPFQWNWDAAITALGWMTFDQTRAWQEIEFLLKGQWKNGMVPHIVFHKEVDSYFPGPDVWGVDLPLRTTSISQPPVLASVVKILFEGATDKDLAREKLSEILPKLIAYHLWWYKDRDPESTGLVVSYHPWETGMDNSPAWDDALSKVPPVDWSYIRRDTNHVDSAQRPHQDEYDRYLYLLDFFKKMNFDSRKIFDNSPYKINDIGIISILHKATKDLISLCESSGLELEQLPLLKEKISATEQAISQLWDADSSSFLSKDLIADQLCPAITTGTLMALYGELASPAQAEKIKVLLQDWLNACEFGLASTHPNSDKFEAQRYWRGPVWLHINWLIALGTEQYEMTEITEQIKQTSYDLIEKNGYFEYFNCKTGEGCGGDKFSWTAATAIYWFL